MDRGSQRPFPEEMRALLQQMQRTTALLLDRVEQAPSAPPQPSLPATPVQHPPTCFPRVSSRMPPLSRLQPASSCNTPPTESSHTMPGPSCHIPPAQASPFQALPPRHTVYQPRTDNVQAHLSRLFRPHQGGVTSGVRKRKRETPWSHIFICLPETQSCVIPTTEESCFYAACGLGKKNVFFPHNEGDHSFFSEHLFSAFPQLRDAGGFVLARGCRGKTLEELPIPPLGYSLSYIRSASSRAPLYIIPLQQSLTLTPPPVDDAPKVMERCLTCQSLIPLCDLAAHIQECTQDEASNDTEDMDEELAMAIEQSLQEMSPVQQQSITVTADEVEAASTLATGLMNVFQEQHLLLEVEAVGARQGVTSAQQHIREQERVETLELVTINEGTSDSPDLKTVLEALKQGVQGGSAPIHNCINVCREFLLEGSFRAFRRAHFSPLHSLSVMFVDSEGQTEGAVDDGCPSREFLRLLVASLKDSRYFEGPEGSKNLSLVPRGLEFGDYKVIGQMLSLALLQGGVRPSFLSERLYTLLCQQQTGPVTVEEVGDWELRQHLDKIKTAETLEEAQRAVGEAFPALCTLGCARTLQNMESRQALIEEAARAHVEGRVKPALDQLIEGLDCLKVAEAMRAHPDILRPIFVYGDTKLTVQDMMTLFEIIFSTPGSNARRSENLTISFWRDWLIEVGDGSRAVTLEKILIFVSGVEQIPPLGFPQRPQIQFLHPPLEDSTWRRYPEANTCSIILRLPIHATFENFVEYMESGILQSPTFGFV